MQFFLEKDPTLVVQQMNAEQVKENEKIIKELNTETDYIIIVENDPIDRSNPKRWCQEIKKFTESTTIINTKEI